MGVSACVTRLSRPPHAIAAPPCGPPSELRRRRRWKVTNYLHNPLLMTIW